MPVSIGTGRDKKTAYTINIIGSKNVAVSKKFGHKAYESMQHGKVAPCFDTVTCGELLGPVCLLQLPADCVYSLCSSRSHTEVSVMNSIDIGSRLKRR